MKKENLKNNRFTELDVFRGLAAVAVVLFHYTSRYTVMIEPVKNQWFTFPFGFLGVELFFIISGFVIFMTLEKCKTGRDFLVSRFSRLYPVYWAAIIVTIAAWLLLPLKSFDLSVDIILINFSMLQGYFYIPAVDGAYWSLNVELSFYFCMFVIFKAGQLKYIERILFIWLGLACMLAVADRYDLHIPYSIYNIMIFENLPLFASGIIFYRIWKAQTLSLLHGSILLFCLATIIIQFGITEKIFAVTAFYILFLLSIFSYLGWIVVRPLLFLGQISYALYLIHQMVGYRIIFHLTKMGLDYNYAIMLTFFISIALATIMTKFIEQPAMLRINGWWREKKRKNAEALA